MDTMQTTSIDVGGEFFYRKDGMVYTDTIAAVGSDEDGCEYVVLRDHDPEDWFYLSHCPQDELRRLHAEQQASSPAA